jgi:hypothetical protein
MIKQLIENKELLAAFVPVALIVLDAVAGGIPDKILPYIGIARRVVNYILKKRGY